MNYRGFPSPSPPQYMCWGETQVHGFSHGTAAGQPGISSVASSVVLTMPWLWVQCLYGPFTSKLELVILVGPSQLRLFCNSCQLSSGAQAPFACSCKQNSFPNEFSSSLCLKSSSITNPEHGLASKAGRRKALSKARLSLLSIPLSCYDYLDASKLSKLPGASRRKHN